MNAPAEKPVSCPPELQGLTRWAVLTTLAGQRWIGNGCPTLYAVDARLRNVINDMTELADDCANGRNWTYSAESVRLQVSALAELLIGARSYAAEAEFIGRGGGGA